MSKKGQQKWHRGNAPQGEDWSLSAEFTLDEITHWEVWTRPVDNKGWRGVKLVCSGSALAKANYLTGWNGRRLARTKDMGIMNEYLPELMDALEEQLEALSARELEGEGEVKEEVNQLTKENGCV